MRPFTEKIILRIIQIYLYRNWDHVHRLRRSEFAILMEHPTAIMNVVRCSAGEYPG